MRTNLAEVVAKADWNNSEVVQEGYREGEHFRLHIEVTDYNFEIIQLKELFKDGLYIVDPNYNWSEQKEVINTVDEYDERYVYVEIAEVNCGARVIIFSNGDGWGYLVDFDAIVGVAYVPEGNRLKAVIITTYGEWVPDLEEIKEF